MSAPRFFRRLCGIAGLVVLAVAGVAPAHAVIIPAGPPTVELAVFNNLQIYWLPPKNRGIPPAQEGSVRFRYREVIDGVPQDWINPGGEHGQSDGSGLHFWNGIAAATRVFVLGTVWQAQIAFYNGVIGEWSPLQSIINGTPFRPRKFTIGSSRTGFRIDWEAGSRHRSTIDPRWFTTGGMPETGYTVQWRRDGETTHESVDLAVDARSHTQPGLVAGATYHVRVAGTNQWGRGQWGPFRSELPVIAGGPPQVKAWVGKVGGIDVLLASDPGASKDEVQWRKPGLNPPAEWTSLVTENPTVHHQLSQENNRIEPGARYEARVRGFVNNAWQDWSPSAIARSSTHDDLAPRLQWVTVSGAGGDVRTVDPAFKPEVFAYSVYIPSAVTLADFAVQPKTRATKIVVTAPDDSDFADVTVVREKAVVPLVAGEGKTVNLELTSRLGGLSTYTLTIKRDRLRALELVAAEVNAETLSPTDIVPGVTLPLVPAFAPEVRSYDLSVSHHVPKLRLRLAADSTAVSSIVYFNELDADSKFAPVNYPAPLAGRLEDLDDNAGRELKEFALAVGKTQLVIRLHDTGGNEIDQYHIYINRAAQLFLPDMPQTVTAEAGIAQIHVAWTAPRNLHGAAGLERSGYRLRWRYVPAGHAQDYGHWQDAAGDNNRGELLAADAISHTIAGRLYFLPHEAQIAAVNASGIGAWVGAKTTAVKVPAPDAIYELITDDAGDAQLRVQLPLNRTHTKTGFVNFSPHTIADYGVQIKLADAAEWPEVQLSGAHILPPGVTRISTEEESEKGMFLFSGIASAQSYDARAFYTYHDLINNHPAPGPFSPSTRINTAAP
ncbi:MAG: cadherin-like beta sandwich domain-containing protein, partial [Gammaproteobacteria bacterium]